MKNFIAVLIVLAGGTLFAAPVPKERAPDPTGKVQPIGVNFKQIDYEACGPCGRTPEDFIDMTVENEPEKGSAASVAGFKEGDVVQTVGKEKVENQSQFDDCLSKYRPGAVVQMQVLRTGQTVTLTVKLK